MRLRNARLVPSVGGSAGHLGRWAGAACLAGPTTGDAGIDPLVMRRVFELCRAAGSRGAADGGVASLPGRLADALTTDRAPTVALAVVLDDGDAVRIGSVGGAVVSVDGRDHHGTDHHGSGTDHHGSGSGDTGEDDGGRWWWTVRPGAAIVRVTAHLPGEEAASTAPDPLADLRQGIVAAGGFVLVGGAPAAALLRFEAAGVARPIGPEAVIGRDPSLHPDVAAGTATAFVPPGDTAGLSRVHARLRVEGDVVWLTDEGSTNGTFVWDDARRRWRRLVAYRPYRLRAGDQLSFGEVTAAFDDPAVAHPR